MPFLEGFFSFSFLQVQRSYGFQQKFMAKLGVKIILTSPKIKNFREEVSGTAQQSTELDALFTLAP